MTEPNGTPQKSQRRSGRTWRRLKRVLVLFVLLLAIGLGIFLTVPPDDTDHGMIALERRHRVMLHSLGLTLPGTPDLANLSGRLADKGLELGAPVFMRIFKREFELELWMMRDGRFEHFATYPICKWSGRLGPKIKTGDHQAPEGVYTVGKNQLNPNSRWHRSFNLGFPNAFDQSHGRTGSFLMVHGGCGSVGCYAVTNAVISEIWEIVTKALDKGQPRFQVQVFPFRMTEANLTRYAGHPSEPFWRSLMPAHDLFETDRLPPRVSVCDKAYAFQSSKGQREVTAAIASTCKSPKQAGGAAALRNAGMGSRG